MTAFFVSEYVDSHMYPHDIPHHITADGRSPRVSAFPRLLLIVCAAVIVSGCAGTVPATMQGGSDPADGIRVVTHNNTTFDFRDGWRLTFGGIEGNADIQAAGEELIQKDTTLSYWDVSSAASNSRGNSTSRLLLTVLGVILVIGLAALILYAAFPATDK